MFKSLPNSIMNPDKSLCPCDRRALEEISYALLRLADEAAELARYHCLIVDASASDDSLSYERLWSDAMTRLSIYLDILDRERIESFIEGLNSAHSKLKQIISDGDRLKPLI